MSMVLKKSANFNFWGEKWFRVQLTTRKIYTQSSTLPTSPSYLFAANRYIQHTVPKGYKRRASICLCSKLPSLSALLISLEMTTQRLMERRRDGRRFGKASGLLLNLPHGMSGLRVITNYVSQAGQPHNLNSVRTEALYYAKCSLVDRYLRFGRTYLPK